MRSTLRSLFTLLAATVLLPSAVLLLGLWEMQRGAADWAELEADRLRLTRIIEQLEARTPPPGSPPDFTVQFRRNGQLYVGALALSQAQDARDEIALLARVMELRRLLPSLVIWAAGLATFLSVLVLLFGTVLGRLGRSSREVLVRGFLLMRHVMPAVLAIQVVLGTVAFVAVVLFEAAALAHPGLGTGEIKMLGIAGIAVLGSLYVSGTALAGLKRALSAFEPDPLQILGRTVSPAEAPGLWRLVTRLAERLGALKPDAIVVGLTEGFFVSAGPKILEPGERALSGTTLYVPLPHVPLLHADEFAAIIGHELAHFAGADTSYSLRFLPIYAGVGRSLEAVRIAGGKGSASALLSPALGLGRFVMDRFHHAVRHWSRAREFAADAASAGVTSPEAAARALLRTGAIQPGIVASLNEAAERPGTAQPDLVAATFDRVVEQGLDDPATHLHAEQPHPTDTHPPPRDRIAKLGCDLTPSLLAAATAPPLPGALEGLSAYFADPSSLCRAVTGDFLAVVHRNEAAYYAHLETTAAAVGTQQRVLHENTRPGAIFCIVTGIVFAVAGMALGLLGVPGLAMAEAWIVAAVPLIGGLAFTTFGLLTLRRAERPYLILGSEALTVPGLDRPIAWDDIADLDMTLQNNRLAIRLLLPPEAPFPQHMPGRRKVKLDPKRRIVTIRAGLPRKMKAQDLADLIGSYQRAAKARRLLADRGLPLAQPSNDVPSH